MDAISLRRASSADANAFLRAAVGLAIFVVVTWAYWLMQFRIGI